MAGAYGRNNGQSDIQTISARTTFADGQSSVITIGRLPKGALVVGGAVTVLTAFNDATNKLVNVGTSADDDGFATIMSVATIGRIVFDELATSNDLYSTDEVTCILTHARTGTAATAGDAFVEVQYIVPAN